MKAVGEVVRATGGVAILRVQDEGHPDIGAPVVDDQLEFVGRVVDVFGPVARPYVAVTPNEDVRLPTLVGERLYQREN
jgi:RNA-binding protein